MIVGSTPQDMHNKIKKYEEEIKKLTAIVRALEIQSLDWQQLYEGEKKANGLLKCRIADLRLVIRRKGGTKEDEGTED